MLLVRCKSLAEISKTTYWTYITRIAGGLILIWYMALGIQTQLHFPYAIGLMFDLQTYLTAFSHALQGQNPYASTDEWTAYLYPLPGLLVAGLFSLLREDIPRAAVFISVNLALLAVMLKGIAARYGYALEQVWWWFPLAGAFAPLLELLYVGQINVISSFGLFLMVVFAGALPSLAGLGLMLGLVTKLTPAIFFAYLVVLRRYRAAVWTIVLVIAGFAISFLLFGWQSPATYLAVIRYLSQRFSAGPNSMALVSSLVSLGWIEQGAWPAVQQVLLVWIVFLFAASGVCAWICRDADPLFVVMGLGMVVASNVFWYHHYVFVLLPLFVWMGWSRLNPAVVAWSFLGLTLIQLDRWYWTQGLLPHVFVQLSMLGIVAWQLARVQQAHRRARVFVAAGALASVVIIGWFVRAAVDVNTGVARAREWIDRNLPVGAHVALESNGPSINSEKHRIGVFEDLTAHKPGWYEKGGWQYLVTGYKDPGFLNQIPLPALASSERDADFFSAFAPVARIPAGSDEIWVFRTGAVLPAQRVYALWGVNGAEWLELVGYDVSRPAPLPGSSLHLDLFWRTISSRRDRLQLTVHLLDSTDRDVAVISQDLFPSLDPTGRWPEGISRVPITLPIPPTAAPGAYRVQMNLDSSDSGIGRIPVLSREHKLISDKQYIGPFKVVPPILPQGVSLESVNLTFGGIISLQGYAWGNRVATPGQSVSVELAWQSIRKTDKDYTVFLHMLDAGGNLRAQIDTQPFRGQYPTSLWDLGEQVRDRYVLDLPGDLLPGEYTIELGLYDQETLTRLPLAGSEGNSPADHWSLPDRLNVTVR